VKTTGVFLALALAGSAVAQSAPPELQFVSCPIYRDTDAGKKSGCWLTDDHENGQRYDISQAPTKPDRRHAILVEGREQGGSILACGSKPLLPVRVSVLWDVPCTADQLPAEGFTGRKYALPVRNTRPTYEKQSVGQLDHPRDFVIPFEYNSTFVTYQLADYYIQKLVNFALASHAKAITIVGYADTKPTMISGIRIAEPKTLAADRAALIKQWLVGLGVPPGVISIRSAVDPATINHEAFDELLAPSRRRVEVRVVPADAANQAQR
jgi:outer membrane protein OmpA-like peptidoglycan-associated protein